MSTDTLSAGSKPAASNMVVGLSAVVVVLVAGIYLIDRQETRQSAERTANREAERVAQASDRAQLETQWLEKAIRENRAILGMTRYEVEMAKGKPYIRRRGQEQPKEMIDGGAVETWIYRISDEKGSSVLFGLGGLVIYSSDTAGLPLYGNAIRQ